MDDKREYAVIISTCPSREHAKAIARILIERQLAACVQMFPVESMYNWQGKLCDGEEMMLFIKSKAGLFDEIAMAIKENHDYEVPEIIQIPITKGLHEYLKWIGDCTN